MTGYFVVLILQIDTSGCLRPEYIRVVGYTQARSFSCARSAGPKYRQEQFSAAYRDLSAVENEYADNPVGGVIRFFMRNFRLRRKNHYYGYFRPAADAGRRAKRKTKHFIVLRKTEKTGIKKDPVRFSRKNGQDLQESACRRVRHVLKERIIKCQNRKTGRRDLLSSLWVRLFPCWEATASSSR